MINTIESNEITVYYKRAWYPESLYLFTMVDYISRINNIPLCNAYSDIRKVKLKSIIYPSSIITKAAAFGNDKIKEQALKMSIPEFI